LPDYKYDGTKKTKYDERNNCIYHKQSDGYEEWREYDLNNNEIEFNRGKFWVSIVPSRNENQVKFTE
jgi:hypothetical protein